MDRINLKDFHIPKRVGITLEEQAQLDKEAADVEREKNWILYPETFIYHHFFEGEYKLYQDCSLVNSSYGKQIRKWLTEGKGLYLWGGVGVGKTYLALSSLKWQLDRKQIGYLLVTNEFLDNLRYLIGQKDDRSLRNLLDNYCSIPMLILDDFGVQTTTAWADEQLYEVIHKRWLKRDSLITIVTSNYDADELEMKVKDEVIGARIISRIIGMCEVLHIEGKDRRLRQARGEKCSQ